MTCFSAIIGILLLFKTVYCSVKSCECSSLNELKKQCRCNGPNFTEFPSELDNVTELTLGDTSIELKRGTLQRYGATLQVLHIFGGTNNCSIAEDAFKDLQVLHTIEIHNVKSLTKVAKKTFQLQLIGFLGLTIYGCGLQEIPFLNDLAADTKNVSHEIIHLDQNEIGAIPSNALRITAEAIYLEYNLIEFIAEGAFNGSSIGVLSLKGNQRLVHIDERAFAGLVSLGTLDLSNTSIVTLPTGDLQGLPLKVLRLQDTHSMKIFPSVYDLNHLTEAKLTYAFHCCAFKHPETHDPKAFAEYQRSRLEHCSERACNGDNATPQGGQVIRSRRSAMGQGHGTFGTTEMIFGNVHDMNLSGRTKNVKTICCGEITPIDHIFNNLKCDPEPDAFNPCEDVMGNAGLRVAVWFVVVAAIVGNVAVMVVLMSSRFKMTVSKYLMCNLAFADFCMGLYLLMVASEDAHTVGEYFNHAISWQEGSGCQVAGFLTVFASELSIFTLTVITLERWYAITYAIHLNKRLKLGTAKKVMIFGWAYSACLAALPLLGVSNYTKTSICLPFSTEDNAASAYLISLLTINGLAFVLICGCYCKMYLAISGHNSTVTQSDKTVAKRMALLVFTDFACWAPTAFFGLTAVGGYPLINVTNSKILLVFFYPLNSCANPFLYAIFTKQYHKDLYMMLGRYGFCVRRANCYLHPGSNITTPRTAVNSTSALSESSLRNSVKAYYFSKCKKKGSEAAVVRNPSESSNSNAPSGAGQKESSLILEGGKDEDHNWALGSVVEECSEVFTSEEVMEGPNYSPCKQKRSPHRAKNILNKQNDAMGSKSILNHLRHCSYDTSPEVELNLKKPYEDLDCEDALLQHDGVSTS